MTSALTLLTLNHLFFSLYLYISAAGSRADDVLTSKHVG